MLQKLLINLVLVLKSVSPRLYHVPQTHKNFQEAVGVQKEEEKNFDDSHLYWLRFNYPLCSFYSI